MPLNEENSTNAEEADAILHAEREWNVLRTVPIGSRDCAFISGTLSGGSDAFKFSARDTRVYLIVQNLSTTDYLVLSKTNITTKQNGGAPVFGGVYFAIPPSKTFSLPSRCECYLMAPSDVSKPVPFTVADCFD